MKGGTPAILYNMCLDLDKLYNEPIDDLDESIRKKVHALFMTRLKDFCTVETAGGTKVGRDWKVVKSEYVVLQEDITRKQHDLHDDHKLNQPAGTFTERSIHGSPRSCVL